MLFMDLVQVTAKHGIAEIVLNRPPVNAMSQALLRELRAAFDRLAADGSVRGALVLGAGKCLSAGLDLREVVSFERAGMESFARDLDAAFTAAFIFPKPLAVAVHGHAIAGGLVLAMCGDHIALGSGDYKLGLTELAVGIPLPPVVLEIVRSAAPVRAFRKLVTGAGVHSPAEVFEMGVGDTLLDDPAEDARRWLAVTCGRPAATFRLVKAMQRKEALWRLAQVTPEEREALLDAIMNAKGAMAAALR
jgi:enoyl-CoA hydratase